LTYRVATVREPLEKLDPNHDMAFDEWEVALYLLALSFCIEGELAQELLSSLDVIFKESSDLHKVRETKQSSGIDI
jgi:hypothetical protein